MTSKERAGFRAQANALKPLFQVGKSAVTDTLIAETEDALKARELVKISILKTCETDINEISLDLCTACGCELVQKIGKTIVLYKRNSKEPKIILP